MYTFSMNINGIYSNCSVFLTGVTNNIPLLRDIITERRFVDGDISTKYLPEVYPDGFKGKQLQDTERRSLASIAACIAVKNAQRDGSFKMKSAMTTLPTNYNFEVQLHDYKRQIQVTIHDQHERTQFEVTDANSRLIA
jgi:acetyl/propionyl-CoA carboxylase alpha subunit